MRLREPGEHAVTLWPRHERPRLPISLGHLGHNSKIGSVGSRDVAHHTGAADGPDAVITATLPLRGEKLIGDSVTIEIDRQRLRVLHPLQLLQSKIWNLYALEAKRTAEGLEQARLTIAIVAAYVKEALETQRALLSAIETIARFAATDPARFAREKFGLECMHAVPAYVFEEGVLPAEFHNKRWPQLLKAVGRS